MGIMGCMLLELRFLCSVIIKLYQKPYRISETVVFFVQHRQLFLSARFSKPLQIIRHVLIFDAVFKLSVFSAVNDALSGDRAIAVFQRPASIRILQNMILPRYNDIAVFDLVGFAVKAFR